MNCKLRNSKVLFLWGFLLWLIAAPLQAQSLVSTETAPYWFCIQVQGIISDGTADLVLTAEGDRVFGRPITTATELPELTKQLWRIELSSGTDNYAIVNRASGKKLSAAYDAELGIRVAILSDTPSTEWTIKTVSSGRYYFEAITQPSGGQTNARILALKKENNFALTFEPLRTSN